MAKHKVPVINRPEDPLGNIDRRPIGPLVPTTPWERQLRESLEDALRKPSITPEQSYDEWDEQNRPYTYARPDQQLDEQIHEDLQLDDDVDVQVTHVPRDYPISDIPDDAVILDTWPNGDGVTVVDDIVAELLEGPGAPNEGLEDEGEDELEVDENVDVIYVPSRNRLVFVDFGAMQTFEVDLNQEPCHEYTDAIRTFQAKRWYERSKVQHKRTKKQRQVQAIRTHRYFSNIRRRCNGN